MPTVPKVSKARRIGKWYLPTMAVILVGWLSSPLSPIRRTSDSSTGFQHSYSHRRQDLQQERNQQLMDAYGDRMSLSELEKALEAYDKREGQ